MELETEHFRIFYDQGTERLVPRMAHYCERAYHSVGERLRFHVPDKTPFFFFSNHNEFEQNNIVDIGEGTGGVTEAFKNRFLIFNDGSEEWMEHVIAHEFAHVIQFHILYGGFWKSVRLLKSPFYPLWVMEGMAEWGTGDMDRAEEEMVVRDAVANNVLVPLPELQGFAHLKPNQVTLAYKTGGMAMRFLEAEYGARRVADLLVILKDHFDVSAALEDLLGIDLYRFDRRFREWLGDYFAEDLARAAAPDAYGARLTRPDALPQANTVPALSPDGRHLYYMSDRNGPTRIYRLDRDTGVSEELVGVDWSLFEHMQQGGRGLSVSRDGTRLAFVGEKKQRDYLYLVDTGTGRTERVAVPFDEIRSPVFAPDGDHLVCIGMERGFNDLYLIDPTGRILERLTDGPQDVSAPVFSRDGTHVIFSGEVIAPDLSEPVGRDLFAIDLRTREMRRLTAFDGAAWEPETTPDGGILFVHEHKGPGKRGRDLHYLAAGATVPVRLTDLVGGAFSPRYCAATDTLTFVALHAGERHIYRGARWWEDPSYAAVSDDGDNLHASGRRDKEPVPGDPPVADGGALFDRLVRGWEDEHAVSLFVDAARPYRFEASTDFFLPFFYYSTLEGLVAANIWQASDMLGNHRVMQQMQLASGHDYLDLAAFYSYARWRPQLTVGGRYQTYRRDFDSRDRRRDVDAITLVTTPLDRVQSVSVGAGVDTRQDTYEDTPEWDFALRNHFWMAGYSLSTITGRYLVPTQGRRLSLVYQEGVAAGGGNQRYRSGAGHAVQYIRLPRESTFASRFFYGRSVGEDPQVFRLGGMDRVRAMSRRSLENHKTNVALASGELRLRMAYVHARTKYLFPDFFFKAAYLILFNDIGYGWDNRTEREAFSLGEAANTAGVGISWPTFILQSFQLNFRVQWAVRTDTGNDVWYIALGPAF